MTYRHQIVRHLRFGTLPRFVELQQEKNALLAEAGLPTYEVWSPAFGGLHHMVLEARYPTMAAFEEAHLAAKRIEKISAINAEQLECVIEGTAHDALQRLTLA